MSLTSRTQTTLAYAVLVTLAVLVLFPFYWMTITSFKSEDQMRSLLSMFWPRPIVIENYGQLLSKTDFVAWYGNSATVAICSTLLATAVGTIGAYALARLRFFGRGFLASATLITYLVPPSILFIPLYAFTQAWNEFLYALVFITDGRLRTLPVGLASFITGDVYGWGYLMAGAVLTTLPVIAAYIYLQKYMVEGLTAGGVKG